MKEKSLDCVLPYQKHFNSHCLMENIDVCRQFIRAIVLSLQFFFTETNLDACATVYRYLRACEIFFSD